MEGLIRLQSGYANVMGFGYLIRFQNDDGGFMVDLYLGVSGRIRLGVTKIYEEQHYGGPNLMFPEPKTEGISKFYPAFNMGIRLGFCIYTV